MLPDPYMSSFILLGYLFAISTAFIKLESPFIGIKDPTKINFKKSQFLPSCLALKLDFWEQNTQTEKSFS